MQEIKGVVRWRDLLRPHWRYWQLTWLLSLLTAGFVIGLLALSGWFISAAALSGLVSAGLAFDYFRPAALIRLCAIGRTAGRYAERLVSHHATLALLSNLRKSIFHQLGRQTVAVLQQQQSARTLQKLTQDIEQLDNVPLRTITPWLQALLMSAILLCCYFWLHATLAWYALLVIVVLLLAPAIASHAGYTLARHEANLAEQRRQALLQPLYAMTALLMWQQWEQQQRAFVAIDQECNKLQQRIAEIGMVLTLTQHTLLALLTAVLLWQGAQAVTHDSLSVPLLLAAMLALFGLAEVLLPLSRDWLAYGRAKVAAARLNALITTTSVQAGKVPLPDLFTLDILQLQTHTYPVQSAPSFHLRFGDILQLCGTSGSGKTTFLSMLAAEREPASGSILINDMPLSTWQMAGHVAYLSQQRDIFDLSLAANLRLGLADATDAQLWQVLETVELAVWARQLPQQLGTSLGEYGTAVSGGQAQRIALARLLLRQQPLMLLDEPFTGLDNACRERIWTRLIAHQRTGILIVASHHALAATSRTTIYRLH